MLNNIVQRKHQIPQRSVKPGCMIIIKKIVKNCTKIEPE